LRPRVDMESQNETMVWGTWIQCQLKPFKLLFSIGVGILAQEIWIKHQGVEGQNWNLGGQVYPIVSTLHESLVPLGKVWSRGCHTLL
jgi:hypothetical protein